MNKLLTALIIASLLAFTSSAMAGGAKAPKSLCIDMATLTGYHRLAFKAAGTVPTSNAKAKTYTVTGRDNIGLISGTAYVLPETSVLFATYSGYARSVKRDYDVIFDLTSGVGQIYYRWEDENGDIEDDDDTGIATDCGMLDNFDRL